MVGPRCLGRTACSLWSSWCNMHLLDGMCVFMLNSTEFYRGFMVWGLYWATLLCCMLISALTTIICSIMGFFFQNTMHEHAQCPAPGFRTRDLVMGIILFLSPALQCATCPPADSACMGLPIWDSFLFDRMCVTVSILKRRVKESRSLRDSIRDSI